MYTYKFKKEDITLECNELSESFCISYGKDVPRIVVDKCVSMSKYRFNKRDSFALNKLKLTMFVNSLVRYGVELTDQEVNTILNEKKASEPKPPSTKSVIENAIELTNAASKKNKEHFKALLGDVKFCEEFRTVKIGLPRQCGKTLAIKELAKPGDVIITKSYSLQQISYEFHTKCPVYVFSPIVDFSAVEEPGIRIVWFDEVDPKGLDMKHFYVRYPNALFVKIGTFQ